MAGGSGERKTHGILKIQPRHPLGQKLRFYHFQARSIKIEWGTTKRWLGVINRFWDKSLCKFIGGHRQGISSR